MGMAVGSARTEPGPPGGGTRSRLRPRAFGGRAVVSSAVHDGRIRLRPGDDAAYQGEHHHHVQPMHDQIEHMRWPRRLTEGSARQRKGERLQRSIVLMRMAAAFGVGPERVNVVKRPAGPRRRSRKSIIPRKNP